MKKTVKHLYFVLCFALMFSIPAFAAYIDPSIMTMAVQIITGIAVAVGAVASIVWRRAKKKVQTTLGIDENAKKEVEDDIEFEE